MAVAVLGLVLAGTLWAGDAVPATQPAAGATLPGVQVDRANRRLLIDCEAVDVEAPLEFLCVVKGGNEYESLLRTIAKPSHIHLGLLMLGLEPGSPVRYSEVSGKWLPPQGPPLQISVQFTKGDKSITVPAWKMMRDIKTKKPMSPRMWVFVGSKMQEGGVYAADITGYVVSVVNFDLSLIDVPQIASSSNELLEWEINPEFCPERGAKCTMIIEPAGKNLPAAGEKPTTQPAARVTLDQVKVDRLRDEWQANVASRARQIQAAATEHYRVISELRAEQNRLIEESDRVGRVIEKLEKEYQDLTVPRPATTQP